MQSTQEAWAESEQASPLLFVAVLFAISTPFWALSAATGVMLLPGLPVSALGTFCPALSALLLVLRRNRLPGAIELLSRAIDWRRIFAIYWFAPAFLIPALPLLAAMAIGLASVDTVRLQSPSPLNLGLMLAGFLLGAIGEELGWSGYALEPLQRRFGRLPAALLLGVIWAIWHFVPLLQAHRCAEWIAWWAMSTVLMRIVMVWLYNVAGRSVLLVAIFHATSNLCAFAEPSLYDPRVSGLTYAAVAALIIALGGLKNTDKAQNHGPPDN